jgi:putative peptidoglycan lipid II flippase
LSELTAQASSLPPDGMETVAPVGVEGAPVTAPDPAGRGGIIHAAGINAIGNVLSRVLGMLRGSVITHLFGATGGTSAFDGISRVPTMVYELLIGGMLSAALVPVLSEYATEERREEMEHILSVLLSVAGTVLVAVVVLLELGAHWIAPLLLAGLGQELMGLATLLTRLVVPAVFI